MRLALLKGMTLLTALLGGNTVHAQEERQSPSTTVATTGCSMFHCDAEATGTMQFEMSPEVHDLTWQESDSGILVAQGCSGDGKIIACLYLLDKTGTGTLKAFDPLSRKEIFGSRKFGSYNPSFWSTIGQVPTITADGDIIVTDDRFIVRYARTGYVKAFAPLSKVEGNVSFGMTPVGSKTGVFGHMNGVLTAIDLESFRIRSSLKLLTARGQEVVLSSPPTGSENHIYAVTNTVNFGFKMPESRLFAVGASDGKLVKRWEYPYEGITGASAVTIRATESRPYPIILLHTPAPLGAAKESNQLVAIKDNGDSYEVLWRYNLSSALSVSPLIDNFRERLYLQEGNGQKIVVLNFKGESIDSYDIKNLASGMPIADSLEFNGHVSGVMTASTQTLLLSFGSSQGEFAVAVDPRTHDVLWTTKLTDKNEGYTAAWSYVENENMQCPIVVGPNSGVSMLCPYP